MHTHDKIDLPSHYNALRCSPCHSQWHWLIGDSKYDYKIYHEVNVLMKRGSAY